MCTAAVKAIALPVSSEPLASYHVSSTFYACAASLFVPRVLHFSSFISLVFCCLCKHLILCMSEPHPFTFAILDSTMLHVCT